jgi:DNA (cytosine-5)-methyltransferase 1
MSAYYNENDQTAAAWLRELIRADQVAPGDVDERSIELVRPADLAGYRQCHFFAGIGGWSYALRLAGWPDERAVWTGSCPCQPWSVAGAGAGPDDSRDLWPAWFRLWRECRPGVVFGEQVESPASRAWFDRVSDDVEGIDYAIGPVDLPAACIGAPQGRQRLWFVADADHARWEGRERQGQQSEAVTEREASRRQPLRSVGGHWPPGPGQVARFPVQPHGIPDAMGGCKGYGNAIVPQVAAEVIGAYLDSCDEQPVFSNQGGV